MVQAQIKQTQSKQVQSKMAATNINALALNITPASEAAGLLLRVGLGLLFIVVPTVSFLSRRAVVIIVPIALTMLILANTIVSENFKIIERLKSILSSICGLSAFTLASWSLLSLLWTPFSEEASEHLFKALGTVILGFVACLSLPLKMRAPNLHLVTLGAIAATVLSLAIQINLYLKLSIISVDALTLDRALILLSFLIWPAIAWLTMRQERIQAAFIIIFYSTGIILNIFNHHSNIVIITYSVGFAVFLLATIVPKFTAWLLSFGVCLAVIGAPLLALGLKNIDVLNINLGALKSWGVIVEANALRLLTGIGFEGAIKMHIYALSNPIIDLWIDLGLIGAVAVAAFFANLLLRCLRLPHAMIAPMMAQITSIIIFAIATNTVVQIWFLSSLAVIAIAFMAIKNGEHRVVRPKPKSY